MSPFAAGTAFLAPFALAITAGASRRWPSDPRHFASIAQWAAALGLCVALFCACGVAMFGAGRTGLFGVRGVGLSVNLDALSAILLLLVSFVGLIVVRYSRNYLDGDPGQARFTSWLLITLASVEFLLLAGNLALLLMGWVATSLSLNKLLLFYPERPAAQRAALKKFIVSRLGDLCLLMAAGLLFLRFGTLEIADLNASARSASGGGTALPATLAGVLLVVTAMLKSAQLPLHGWLIEVMETPTPVSALLHAGIINAGGFLILRLADVLLLASPALEFLAIVGGATALFGSLVMLTQTSVKVQLAYSTVAQMGFMLLQCGLGAFPSALLHIVAHSLYKAHAFLSSGSVMDLARASWTPSPGGLPHPGRLALALVAVVGIALAVARTFGMTIADNPGQIAFGAVLLMGLVHLMANAFDERLNGYVISRTALTALAVAVVYFALQAVSLHLVKGSLPSASNVEGFAPAIIAGLVVVSFAGLTIFQNQMMRRAEAPFWLAAYTHLRHGLYLNTMANRLVLALRPRAPSASPSSLS